MVFLEKYINWCIGAFCIVILWVDVGQKKVVLFILFTAVVMFAGLVCLLFLDARTYFKSKLSEAQLRKFRNLTFLRNMYNVQIKTLDNLRQERDQILLEINKEKAALFIWCESIVNKLIWAVMVWFGLMCQLVLYPVLASF